MRYLTLPLIAAGAIVTAPFGFAGAADAAPTAPDAAQAVERLEAHGFSVIVNKVGNAPLDMCTVSAVRPGQTFQRMESDVPGPRGDAGITTIVTGMTIYLDVSC